MGRGGERGRRRKGVGEGSEGCWRERGPTVGGREGVGGWGR